LFAMGPLWGTEEGRGFVAFLETCPYQPPGKGRPGEGPEKRRGEKKSTMPRKKVVPHFLWKKKKGPEPVTRKGGNEGFLCRLEGETARPMGGEKG